MALHSLLLIFEPGEKRRGRVRDKASDFKALININ